MAETTWSFSQGFATDFQTARNDLETRIQSIKESTSQSQDALNELSISLAKLSKRLSDATPSLPTYDQRQYNQHIKALELSLTELRTKAVPKTKFAFKKRAANPSVPAAATTSISLPPAAPTQPTTQTASITLSSQSNKIFTWGALPEFTGRNDLTITDLDHCVVDLVSKGKGANQDSGKIILAVHITNLSDTLLILPVVEGSVLIHKLVRSTIVVGCRQFRMHDSHHVHVYLSVPSNPVIEQCDQIHFTNYPDNLALIPEDHKPSKHQEVLDFTHILPTPSSHWSVLSDEHKVNSWPHEEGGEQLLNDLKAFLPR